MSKSKLYIAGALAALFVLALALAPNHAFAKQGKHQLKAKGVVTAIDTTAGTVTIHDKKSDQDVTVSVTEMTRIHKNENEHATLADLAVGDKAAARYDTATMNAKRIQAKSPKVKPAKVVGTISAIDADAQSVTIQPKKGDAVTVFVTADTKINRNDAPATFADLVVGDHAAAKYDPNTMQATKINASSEDDD
jgi:Cu/Ag efflux protein CusF